MSLASELLALAQLSAAWRADGRSEREIAAERTRVLRQIWPVTPGFRYRCEDCQDSGAIPLVCKPGQRCGKGWCAGQAAYEHDYVRPCECPAGQRFRRPSPPDQGSEIARAARTAGHRTRELDRGFE